MASKADFTEEEWELLREAPPGVGMVVIVSDRGGMMRESFSMAKAYAEARKQPGASQLLDELVEAKPDMDHTRYGSKEELVEAALQRASDALALIGQKGTEEDVEQFRGFLWSVAEHVANARKEGFMGLTGERVSDAEEAALERIKATLGIAQPST
jgi:hypothetical protein